MIVTELKIPQMFSAYAEDLGYVNVKGCHIEWATAYSGMAEGKGKDGDVR